MLLKPTSTHVSDGVLSSLKQVLQKNPLLQGISLSFQGSRGITDIGMEHLGLGLQTLTSLKHLSLNFAGPIMKGSKVRITDDGLWNLSQGLEKLASLQHLTLRFQR